MQPVTGPFSRTEIRYGPANYYGFRPLWLWSSRTWYRQSKPYNLPLSYTLVRREVTDNSNTVWYTGANAEYDFYPGDNGTRDSAYNKAYSKFRDDCYKSAQLAASIAEHKQALGMISSRAVQLLRFGRALKRFRFDDAARILGMNRVPKHLSTRSGPKVLANNWLEFHFGWSPLVKDVYDACDILQSSIPMESVVGKATSSIAWATGPDSNGVTRNFFVTSKVRLQAFIRVDNPNLGLATQLGVTNPASVVWELIPFSFVVDWFVNVGDFLQAYTDFAGFTIENPQRMYISRSTERRIGVRPGDIFSAGLKCVNMDRVAGPISGPKLRVKDNFLPSPVRAITEMALLIQFLPR